MKPYTGLLLRLTIFCLLLLAPAMALSAPQEAPYKIGFIGPLTGPAASYGSACKNGIQLALDDLGAAAPIHVSFEDDQFQVTRTLAAFRKFSEMELVDAVISTGSGPSNAIAPLAQAKNLLLLAWASDPRVSRGRMSVLRTSPSGQAEGAAAALEAARLKYADVGIYTIQSDYGNSVREGFLAALPKQSLRTEVEVQPETTDFRSLILKARARSVKEFFLCLNPGQPAIFAKQLRELKLQAAIFGCQTLDDLNEFKLSEGALNDAWFVAIQPSASFRKRYIERFGNENLLSGAATHYDLMHSLARALARTTQDRSSHSIIQALIAADEQQGAVSSFRYQNVEGDQHMQIPYSVRRLSAQGIVD